ncbi:hypothetical protein GCM10010451_30480 [Streptomyces virens]|uniref:Uncharacterized protein n=1 Tax=Streptomyces virens TaxID=285572 RepID=A0ABP6PIC3_9ACTN|nr:hypothetical protein GCM10010247_49170 [Streptomyces calvus]
MLVGVPTPGQSPESDPGHTQAGTAEMPLLHERRHYWPEPAVWGPVDNGFPTVPAGGRGDAVRPADTTVRARGGTRPPTVRPAVRQGTPPAAGGIRSPANDVTQR